MTTLDKNISDLKVLISEREIQEKSKELAKEAENLFDNDEDLYVVCVLKGSIMFCAELIKYFKRNIQLEFIRISSYGNETKSSQNVQNAEKEMDQTKGEQQRPEITSHYTEGEQQQPVIIANPLEYEFKASPVKVNPGEFEISHLSETEKKWNSPDHLAWNQLFDNKPGW